MAKLERIFGSTACSSSVAVDQTTGLVAYPAGSTIVVCNPRTLSQAHLCAASATTSSNGGGGVGYNQHHQNKSNGKANQLTCLAFSPNGRYICSGEFGADPKVRVWQLRHDRQTSAQCLAELTYHRFGISCTAFTRDSAQLISVGNQHDKSVVVWDWRSGTKLAENRLTSQVNAMDVSEGGRMFVTVGVRHVKFWYLESSSGRANGVMLQGRSAILADHRNNTFVDVCCAPNNRTFAITVTKMLVEFVDKKLVNIYELGGETAYSLTLGSGRLFIGFGDSTIRAMNIDTLAVELTLRRPHRIGVDVAEVVEDRDDVSDTSVKNGFFPDVHCMTYYERAHSLTVFYADRSIYHWQFDSDGGVAKISSQMFHVGSLFDVQVVPSMSAVPQLAGNFLTAGADDTIRMWNLDLRHSSTGTVSNNNNNNDGNGQTAWNELRKIFYVSNSNDSLCEQPDKNFGGTLSDALESTSGIRCIRLSANSMHLACGGRDGNVYIFQLDDGARLLEFEAHEAEVLCLDYSDPAKFSGRNLLASGSRDRFIHVFNADADYAHLMTVNDHSCSVSSIKFLFLEGIGGRLITCGTDKIVVVRQFDVLSEATAGGGFELGMKRLNQISDNYGVNCLCVSGALDNCSEQQPPQSRLVAACQDRHIRIFSPLNGELLTTLNGTPSGGSISDSGGSSGNGNGTLTKLCLDPSETFAATVCSDRYVYVIDLLNGDCVAALRGQADCITAIQFSADCRRLIVVSYNGCIFVWRLNANLIKRMNARLNASSATNRCITPDSVIGGGELSDSASLLNQQHHHQPTTRKSLLAVGASGGDTTGGSNASGSEFGSLTSVNIVQEDDVDSGVGGGGIAGGGCSGGTRQPQQPFKAVIQSCGAGGLEHRPFELRRVSTEVRRSTGNLHAVTADGHQQHQLEEQQAAAVDKAAMISNNGSNDHHHQQQQHALFMEQQQHQQQQAQQQQNYYQIGGGVGEIYYPPGAVVQPPTVSHQHYYPASAASAPRGAAARLAGAINGGGGNTMLTPTTSRSMSNLSGGRGMAVSPQRAPRRRWNTPQIGQQPQPPSYDAFQQQQQKMMMGGGGGRPTANGTMNASISLNALRTAGVTTGGMPTAYGNGGVAAYAVPPQNVQQQFYGAPMPQQHFAVTRYGVGSASNLQPQNQQSILYGGGMMEGEAAGLMQMRLAASNGSTTGIRGAGGIDENFGRKSSTRNSFSKRYLRNIEEKTVWKPGSAEIRKRSTSSLFSNTPSAFANVQQHGLRSRDANNNVSFAADASACDVNNNNNTNNNNNNDETESVGSAGHRRYHSASSAANGRRRRVSVTMALTDELPPNAEDGEDTVEEEESVSSASPLRRKSGRLSNVSGGNGRSTSSRILNRIRERRLSSIIVNGGGGGGAIDARPNGAAGAAWRRSGGGTQRTNANGSGIDVSPSGGVGGRTTALRSKSPTQLAMKAMAAAAINSIAVADEEVNDDDASSLASPSSTLQRRRRTQSPSSVTAAASPSRLRQRQHENSFASTVSSPASTSRQYVALQQRRQSGGVAVTPLQARLLEARQMLKKSQENLTALAAATATTTNDDASSMLRSHSIGNLKFGGGVCLNSGGDQRKLPSASNTTTSSAFNEDGADTLSGYGKRQMAKSVNSLLQTHIDDEAPRPPVSKPKHFDEGGGGEMTSRLGQSIRDLRKNSNPDLTNERTYTEDEDETEQFSGGKRNNNNNARLMDTAHHEYYSSSTLPRNLRRGVQKKLDRNITPTSRFRSRLNGGVGATTGSTNNADDSLPDDEADDDDVAEQFVQAAYHNYGGGQAGQYYATPATTSSPRSFSSLETRNAGVTSRRTFDALSHGGAASTRRTPNYLAQRFCGADFGVPDTAPLHEDLAATTAISFVGGGKAAAHRGSTTSIDFLSSVDVETLSTQNAKKMAMHTWECIQEMTKACDKLLGARQLICGDASSVAATADHERLAMSVERVITTFRNRLDAALTADTAVSDDGNAAAAASQAEH